MTSTWETIAAQAREKLYKSIPKQYLIPADIRAGNNVTNVVKWARITNWFTPEEQKITSTSATELLEMIAKAELSAETVAKAFCKKAAAAQQLTNCLTNLMFDDAIATAKELDAYLTKNGKVKGPLHGLPVSLKDCFKTTGYDSTLGFTSLVGQPATYDSKLVEWLRKAGAVFYCKTNIPTAMMAAETNNQLFGRCNNSLNLQLTPGGSSGGESALISFGASPLGVGTDLGGSVRIPAAFTGIYALRPSYGRTSTLGNISGLPGQEAVVGVTGPMSKDFETLELFMRTIVGMEPWLEDPKCLPIPWRSVGLPTRKLKLGVIWNDGVVRPTPPVRRALKETVAKLRQAGFEIVDWDPVLHKEMSTLLGQFYLADGGIALQEMFETTGEPYPPHVKAYETAPELGANALWKMQVRRNQLLKDFLEEWNDLGIDGLIGPISPWVAAEHGKFGPHVGYTGVFNLLDYPAVSFPSGVHADKNLDVPDEGEVLGEMDVEIQTNYNADLVHEMPIGLQLVARRLEDEKVLMMMREILKVISA